MTLLVSWLGGDLLRIALVVQGQAWRSLWLATAIAALLLPWISARCWTGPPLQRCVLPLILTAWIIGHQSLALCFSIPALVIVAYDQKDLPERITKLTESAAWILLTVIVICMLSLTWTGWDAGAGQGSSGTWLDIARSASR